MARGGEDSDEERHDRFRSERNSTTIKPLFPGGSKKRSNLNSSLGDGRPRDRRRSRDRSWRDRSPDDRRRDIEDRRSHKRRSYSPDREEQSRKKIRERSRSTSYEKRKSKHKSRGSSEGRSGSYSSHDSRTDRKRSRHPKRSKDKEEEKPARHVDTFMQRFERRRDSSVEEEVVDNNIVYRDTSQSPERTKHKKKKNGEREKRKDKKKDKKKKKKSSSLERDDKISILRDAVGIEDLDSVQESLSPKIGSPRRGIAPDLYGPRMPPSKSTLAVPSSSPEASLPGNRSSLAKSTKNLENEDISGPVASSSNEKRFTEGSAKGSVVLVPDAASQKDSSRVYGPVLPQREAVASLDDDESSYGPALPPRLQQPKPAPSAEDVTDDEDFYGPLPAGLGGRTQEELEMRAALIKRQLRNQEESESRPKKREAWMLELPDSKRADLGLGPRKFRSREAPDMSDRSSWTDTPEEKKRKEEMSRLGIDVADNDDDNTNSRLLGIIQRDKEMEKKAREGRKKDKSLLDMHQKELKKKKKKEEKERAGKKEERRPFSRDVDLQTNRFDEAQKRSIIKKAQLLDSRFSRGESKFL